MKFLDKEPWGITGWISFQDIYLVPTIHIANHVDDCGCTKSTWRAVTIVLFLVHFQVDYYRSHRH